MKRRLLLWLLLLWLLVENDAAWTAYAVVNRTLAYAVPALLDAGVDAPLIRLDGVDAQTRTPQGVRALACCARDGQPLAALNTCVVLAETEQRIAGDCLEAGTRDGAPGGARFLRLSMLAAATSPFLFLFAAFDAAAMRVVIGTPWRVASVDVLYDNRPPDALSFLARMPAQASWLLTLSGQTVWISESSGPDVFASWVLVDVLSAASDPITNAILMPPLRLVVVQASGVVQERSPLTGWGSALTPVVDANTTTMQAGEVLVLSQRGNAWAVNPSAETRRTILRTSSAAASSATATTTSSCPASLCAPGTFFAGATGACQRCPPNTSAPLAGAIACATCPANASLQGPLGRSCVSVCPPWTQACAECPLAGQQWQQGACRPCPPMTFAPLGSPCAPCPPGYASVGGAATCTPRNTADACLPTGNASELAWSTTTVAAAEAWGVYTTDTPINADDCALAAARNGSLWLAVAGSGLVLFSASTTQQRVLVLPLPDIQCTLALSSDERVLYAADARGGLHRITNERALSRTQALNDTRAEYLCFAGASLFARTANSSLVNAAGKLWYYDAGGAMMIRMACWGARLLVWDAVAGVGVVDPLRGVFEPLFFFASPAPSPAWIRVLDASTAVVASSTGVDIVGLPGGEVLQQQALLLSTSAQATAGFVLTHSDGVAPMLLFADTGIGRLQALWARGCECAPGFVSAGGACAQCMQGTSSDVGATACTSCGYRQFFDDTLGQCAECPPTLWWRAAPTLSCALLWSAAPSQAILYTLARAQELALLLRPSEIYVPDAFQDAFRGFVSANLYEADGFGAFWALRFAWAAPYDPDGVAVAAAAGLSSPLPGLLPSPTPMRYNCTSPTHYWIPPSPSTYLHGACAPCPRGLFAWSADAVTCAAPTDGGPSRCAAGFYLALYSSSGNRTCRPCPPNTFSATDDAEEACTPKATQACGDGAYVYDDGLGVSDNVCVPCETCELRVPASANCSGGLMRAQPYRCVSDHPPPGFVAVFDPQLSWRPCGPLPADAAWSQGPRADACYVRCRWGAQTAALQAFLQQEWAAQAETWADVVGSGLIPYTQALAAARVCFPNISSAECPDGFFFLGSVVAPQPPSRRRLLQLLPESSSSSGTTDTTTAADTTTTATTTEEDSTTPPDSSSSSSSNNDTSFFFMAFTSAAAETDAVAAVQSTSRASDGVVGGGCVPLAALPPHAHAQTDGGWACDAGFFLTSNRSSCAACVASSCREGEWFASDECVCYLCPSFLPQAALVAGIRGACAYQCVPPARPNPTGNTPPCLSASSSSSCQRLDNQTQLWCPPGQRWVGCACDASACGGQLQTTQQPAPSADGVCRVYCRAGLHTIDRASLLAVADPTQPQDPSRILCEPCVQRPSVPCPPPPPPPCAPSSTPCLSAENEQGGSYQCGDLCVRCPGQLGPLQVWATGCTVACVRDAYMAFDGKSCVPCGRLPVPAHAPYAAFHATWNATPGRRWWPRAYDPPHLTKQRRGANDDETRSGVCWPCAVYVRIGLWDSRSGDPCATLPSPWLPQRAPNNNNDAVDVRLGGGGRRLLGQAYTLDRRQLRWQTASPQPPFFFQLSQQLQPPQCPRGWFAGVGQCVRCPRGTRGASDGTCRLALGGVGVVSGHDRKKEAACVRGASPRRFEPALCACRVGSYLDVAKQDDNQTATVCRRCPADTVSRTLSNAPCVPLPFPAAAVVATTSHNETAAG